MVGWRTWSGRLGTGGGAGCCWEEEEMEVTGAGRMEDEEDEGCD
jgi:hypothetical protein